MQPLASSAVAASPVPVVRLPETAPGHVTFPTDDEVRDVVTTYVTDRPDERVLLGKQAGLDSLAIGLLGTAAGLLLPGWWGPGLAGGIGLIAGALRGALQSRQNEGRGDEQFFSGYLLGFLNVGQGMLAAGVATLGYWPAALISIPSLGITAALAAASQRSESKQAQRQFEALGRRIDSGLELDTLYLNAREAEKRLAQGTPDLQQNETEVVIGGLVIGKASKSEAKP